MDLISNFLSSFLSVLARQPFRLLIALALGATLQAASKVLSAGHESPTLDALRELDIGYYIAFSFFLAIIFDFFKNLFSNRSRELEQIEKEISLLSKALDDSNLTDDRKRMIWRTVSHRLVKRITPADRNG